MNQKVMIVYIDDETYTQIDYIDYEPESDDSIYEFESLENELSENEIEENNDD